MSCWGKTNRIFFRMLGLKGGEPFDGARRAPVSRPWPSRSRESTGQVRSPEEIAEEFLRVAVENMANAIKRISVQRGRDATEYILQCFGGAGGQHACRVADTSA